MRRMLTVAGVTATFLVSTAASAAALPPPPRPGDDVSPPVPHCAAGKHWDEETGRCVPAVVTTPAKGAAPRLTLDEVRQSHTRDGVRVRGGAADPDAPESALTVRVSVDGGAPATVVADTGGHGFTVVVPAPADGRRVCVTAVGSGDGGDATECRGVDRILRFEGHALTYDLARAVLESAVPMQIDRVSYTNGSTVPQRYEINRSTSIRNTHGWSVTAGLTVKASGEGGVPLLANGKWEATGSVQFSANGSTEEVQTFTWRQPVDIPAKTRLLAVASATKSTVTAPYVMTGEYVFESGAREDGEVRGRYTGISSQDVQVDLKQFDLDGNPMLTAPQTPPPVASGSERQ